MQLILKISMYDLLGLDELCESVKNIASEEVTVIDYVGLMV